MRALASPSDPSLAGLALSPREERDRVAIISRCMIVTNPDALANPQQLFLRDADLARQLVTENAERLEKVCRVMAERGRRGSWVYDLPLHTAALEVLRRERWLKEALDGYVAAREAA